MLHSSFFQHHHRILLISSWIQCFRSSILSFKLCHPIFYWSRIFHIVVYLITVIHTFNFLTYLLSKGNFWFVAVSLYQFLFPAISIQHLVQFCAVITSVSITEWDGRLILTFLPTVLYLFWCVSCFWFSFKIKSAFLNFCPSLMVCHQYHSQFFGCSFFCIH